MSLEKAEAAFNLTMEWAERDGILFLHISAPTYCICSDVRNVSWEFVR